MRVHGLKGELVPPDWPQFTIQEMISVCAAFGIEKFAPGAWSSQRPFSTCCIIAGEQRDFFIKRHSIAIRPVGTLEEEHCFITHLRGTGGFHLPRVLRTLEGDTVHYFGPWAYEVHRYLLSDGRYEDAPSWTPPDSQTDAQSLGVAMARLHNRASLCSAPPRRARFLVADDAIFRSADPIDAITQRAGEWPELAAALKGRPWQKDIERYLLPWHHGERTDRPLWTHNDLHVSNAFYWNTSLVAIIDFGMCNRTSAAFDLATALERNAVAWLRLHETNDIAHPEMARALIAGYRKEHPDVTGLAEAVTRLLPVVHAEFALSEMAYFEGILHSPERTRIAYEDFLLAHAAWFATTEGRTFLDEVGRALA